MNPNVEQAYQEIGRVALEAAGDRTGKLIVYSEVEDGVISADVFYLAGDGVVRYRFSPKELKNIIYSFWQLWKGQPGNAEWRTMTYVIDGGKFSMKLAYPDHVDPEEDLLDRRKPVLDAHFGGAKVDYSNPR